jgi:hypothetical protein
MKGALGDRIQTSQRFQKRKQKLEESLLDLPREKFDDNCYLNLYNGSSGGMNNPTAGNDSSVMYEQQKNINIQMQLPPPEPVVFNHGQAFSLNPSFSDQVYVRNLDLDKRETYIERKGKYYKVDDDDDVPRRFAYNVSVCKEVMPDLPGSSMRAVQESINRVASQSTTNETQMLKKMSSFERLCTGL